MTAGIAPDLLDAGLAEDLAVTALALARRFHAGATMWCAAPSWEPHAHHMAVEFVHPVIVGKRALPAFALAGPDLVSQARVAARPGDILIAVSEAGDANAADLMRRTRAWGALSVWIGSGGPSGCSVRPPGGAADHILWIDDPDPAIPATGQFVLLYHLLWELTHVCFEHPGLLTAKTGGWPYNRSSGPAQPGGTGGYSVRPPGGYCADDVCITCSDEGRLGEVITPPDGPFAAALARTATGEELVDVTLVGPVSAGDLILIHAGAALARAS
jgi:hypothetical protein